MSALTVVRVSALPETLVANTIYLLTASASELQVVAVGDDISAPRKTFVSSTIFTTVDTKISEALANYYTQTEVDEQLVQMLKVSNEVIYAADITARNALLTADPALDHNALVMVADASDDATVDAGAALYFFVYDEDNPEWIKIAEYESLDFDFSTALDSALPNAAVLAKLDEDGDGNLTYNNNVVGDVVQGTHEW